MPTSHHDGAAGQIPHDGAARPAPPPREAGLTLVELLLVLAILALASGLVLGRGFPGKALLEQARLDGFLVDARIAAMRSGQTVTLSAQPGQLAASTGGPPLATLSPDADIALPAPIWFLPDGTSNGGGLRLTRPDGTQYGVDIAAPTGHITRWP